MPNTLRKSERLDKKKVIEKMLSLIHIYFGSACIQFPDGNFAFIRFDEQPVGRYPAQGDVYKRQQ